MEEKELIIIGGGISGLTLAHHALNSGWDILLLEREARMGGCLHTHRAGPEHGDFWQELGAHTTFNSYGTVLGLLDGDPLLAQARQKKASLFKFQAGDQLKSIFSLLSWPELLVSLPRMFSAQKSGKTVAEYYEGIFGARNYRNVFDPAFNAVICQPAADFPADLLFRKKPRRKDVPRGFTFDGGLQDLVDAVVARHPETYLRGQTVQSIQYQNGRFSLVTDNGDTFRARKLAVATPVDHAAKLLREAFPQVSEHLHQIPIQAVETLAVAIPAKRLTLPRLAGIIGTGDAPFYSAVSRDVLPHDDYRGFTFHFKPGATDQKKEVICRVLDIQPQDIVWQASKSNFLPALRRGHQDWIARLDARLADLPLAVAGNYFHGVSLEDSAQRAQAEFFRLRALGG